MNEPVVFLSYSHEDASTVAEDLSWLQSNKLSISSDRDIIPGTDWRGHIASELTQSAIVIFFSSEHSNRSKHCLAEVGFALDMDKPVLVIHLDERELAPGLRLYLGNKQAIYRQAMSLSEYQANVLEAVTESIKEIVPGNQPQDDYLFSVSVRASAAEQSPTVDLIEEFMKLFALLSPVFDLISQDQISSPATHDLQLSFDVGKERIKITALTTDGRQSESEFEYDSLRSPTGFVRQIYEQVSADASQLLGVEIREDLSVRVLDADVEDLESFTIYIRAMLLDRQGYLTEALEQFESALAITPKFAMALYSAGVVARNLYDFGKCQKYLARSIANGDKLTERQRFDVRNIYLIVLGDFHLAIKELESYISSYPNQGSTIGNLALTYLYARRTTDALEASIRAANIRGDYFSKMNVAMYMMYGSQFEDCQNKLAEIGFGRGMWNLESTMAICQVLLNRGPDAKIIYESLCLGNESQHLIGTIGLSDLAAYNGDYMTAHQLANEAISKSTHPFVIRLVAYASLFGALAEAEISEHKQLGQAIDEVIQSGHSSHDSYFIGRAAAQTGRLEQAEQICDVLGDKLDGHGELYEELLTAELMLIRSEKPKLIIAQLNATMNNIDSWMGRFLLAQAYQNSGKTVEAHLELERCLARPGEAVALLLDEIPTLHLYGLAQTNYEETKRLLANI